MRAARTKVIAVAVAVAVAGLAGGGSSPAVANQAPSVFLAPDGNDNGSCTLAAPCNTLARGYAVATAGATVQVAAGVYPAQVLLAGSGKQVVFQGVPGTTLRKLDNSASNVTFDGIDVDANFATPNGAAFQNHGFPDGENVTFRNASIGNVTDEKGALVSGDHFTFENVVFHDVLLKTPGVHNECVFAIVVPNMVVRNSTFRECATMDLFFTYGDWWTPLPPPYGNVTLEGNTFYHSTCSACASGTPGWHYYGLFIGGTGLPKSGTLYGWRIRNNWFENSVVLAPTDAGDNVFCGSTGPSAPASWKAPCATPPPPRPAYHPACEPTCDEQITDLDASQAQLEQEIAVLKDKLAQIRVLSAP